MTNKREYQRVYQRRYERDLKRKSDWSVVWQVCRDKDWCYFLRRLIAFMKYKEKIRREYFQDGFGLSSEEDSTDK